MTGSCTRRWFLARLAFGVAVVAGIIGSSIPARAVVKYSDGFGDADRNNDGVIAPLRRRHQQQRYVERSERPRRPGTRLARNHRSDDSTNANDVGIVWSGIRSFDTAANIPKATLRSSTTRLRPATKRHPKFTTTDWPWASSRAAAAVRSSVASRKSIELGDDGGDQGRSLCRLSRTARSGQPV